jgi:type I restriction enzyme S subunit
MNIKQGYKQTEIGIIPEDWEVKKLSDISQLITKGTTPKKFSETGINFIKIECFEGNLINQEKCAFIDIITHSTELKRSILQEGDILFAIAGATIGKCNVVQSEILPANTNQALAIVRLKQNENREFVYRLLASYKMQKYITDNVSVGAQPNLNLEQIGNFLFAYPLFSEQTAIATALSDIDALIGELDKLIAKKQGIKQATMQQLLTGKKRLAGFSGEWEVKRLGELLDYEQPTKYLVSSTEYNDHNNVAVLTAGKSFVLGYTNEEHGIFQNLPVIIFDDFTTTTKYVDFPFKVKSSAMKMLKPKNEQVNLKFLFEKIQTIRFLLNDHKRYWISEYQKLEIELPSIEEQNAIANILSDMDAEISQLEGRRAKMGELKQGMMQELLTGRIRLTGGRYL